MMRIFYLVPLLVISACVVRDCPEPEAPPPPQSPPGGGGPIVEPPPSSGAVCGTRGAAECAPTDFCDFPDGTMCGAADQGGVCRPRPEACTMDYTPVCGCDGRTYGNACSAHRAGVDVSSRGECGAGGGGDPGATGGCVPGGCSGHVCVAQGDEIATTCEWRPEYACYRTATCARQADGTCGWTQTPELAACLRNPPRE